jgi:hypothetical protein
MTPGLISSRPIHFVSATCNEEIAEAQLEPGRAVYQRQRVLPPTCFAVVSVTFALGLAACGKENPQAFGGTATVSWAPVKTDMNGKNLTNLAGYKIHYGRSPGAMYTVVVLNNPNQTTYIVKNLAPGTWYFAVSAFTSSGSEGALTDVASKTIK